MKKSLAFLTILFMVLVMASGCERHYYDRRHERREYYEHRDHDRDRDHYKHHHMYDDDDRYRHDR